MPDNWRVNGIVDGIYDEYFGTSMSGDVTTQGLVIPLPAERPSEQPGQWSTAGVLIGYEEAP